MTKTRLLSIALVVLVVLNVATLSFFFLHRPPPPHPRKHEGPKAIIIERLRFNDEQVKAYDALIDEHHKRILEMDAEMLGLRDRLYAQLSAPDSARKDSLLHAVGDLQSAIERVHVDHFAGIKALCKPDQLPLFDQLTRDLASYFHQGGPPPRPER